MPKKKNPLLDLQADKLSCSFQKNILFVWSSTATLQTEVFLGQADSFYGEFISGKGASMSGESVYQFSSVYWQVIWVSCEFNQRRCSSRGKEFSVHLSLGLDDY